MTEEKKTETKKTTSTTKKTTTRRSNTTTAKSTKSKSATTATKATPKKEKEFKPDTLITCKSVRPNHLFYKSNVTNIEYDWNGFGDIRQLTYQDIMSMKSSNSPFLFAPWILIEDEDLMERNDFKRDLGKIYEIYKDFDSPREFFERPLEEIREKLQGAPEGFKDLIVYNAAEFIRTGELDRLGVINIIDEVFGTQLRRILI